MSSRNARVRAAAALRGSVVVPGDKSISHRALILASQARGTTLINGLSRGGDVKNTARALRHVSVTRTGEIEAGDDDNTIVLRVARPLGHRWDLDARIGWYRNEALLLGVYYRKQVISLGVSQNFGSASSF